MDEEDGDEDDDEEDDDMDDDDDDVRSVEDQPKANIRRYTRAYFSENLASLRSC